jgi:dihydroorotate dehydrogenase (NAD+) catalytic subunit
MIELAPNHKIGLSLTNPVMIAAGCGGYGPAYRPLIDLSAFGALVTNPITLRPQHGIPQPRLVETTAGLVLNTGEQNPGVKKVIQLYAKIWRNLGIPVIAHLPAAEPDDLCRAAGALAGVEVIAAIELGLPDDAVPREVAAWLRAVREGGALPVLVKLPLTAAVKLAAAAEDAQADALVVGSPPPGTALAANGQMVSGYLYGPAMHSLVLRQMQLVRAEVDLPIIACGGIHSPADAQAFLSAGSVAVQLDTLLWIEPQQAEAIARQLTVNDKQ